MSDADRLAAIEQRLASIERDVARLVETTGQQSTLLIGWDSIARVCGKRPGTLRRYVKYGFPAIRWGRQVTSSLSLITAWLVTIEGGRLNGTIPRYQKRRAVA